MSQKLFDTVKMTAPGRSTFDLSHDVKQSMKFGYLYPMMIEEVAPGDKWNIGCESLIRFAPMISPVMHKMHATMHYFYVPMRLLWDNFFAWYKGEKDPLTNLPYVHPYFKLEHNASNYAKHWNYLGIPDPDENTGRDSSFTKISPMPMAAYNLIYNEYYRDQNLIDPVPYKLTDGENSEIDFQETFKRAWMHDYFTSALPFAQKGDPVEIPMSGLVELDPSSVGTEQILRASATHNVFGAGGDLVIEGTTGSPLSETNVPLVLDPNNTLVVNQGSATLNDLRIAMRVQEWLEKSARGGTRDNEFIRAQFGVKTSDARLQRPEYITGIKTPVVISEVLNTTGTIDAPQGQMAGHGVGVVNGRYGSYYAEEPGYIIGIMNVQPTTAYSQGIPKHFLKVNEPTEKLFPVFGNLGEQEILRKEVYAYTSVGDQTFGYIPRYSEYKYSNNRIAGDFINTLDFWHLSRLFNGNPALNKQFIECDATTRIFAVDDGVDYLWCHIYNKVKVSRLLPFYGTPTF